MAYEMDDHQPIETIDLFIKNEFSCPYYMAIDHSYSGINCTLKMAKSPASSALQRSPIM